MSRRSYPRLIGNGNSLGAIEQGHNLSPDRVQGIAQEFLCAEVDEVVVDECWLRLTPRVMWCSRLDGWGCDMEGEWHGHWTEVEPNGDPRSRFTTIYMREAIS